MIKTSQQNSLQTRYETPAVTRASVPRLAEAKLAAGLHWTSLPRSLLVSSVEWWRSSQHSLTSSLFGKEAYLAWMDCSERELFIPQYYFPCSE
jgi:hypothetical protein